MIKRVSIVALILLLIGIVGTVFTVNTQFKQAQVLEEKVITANDFQNVMIETKDVEVIVLPTNTNEAKIELFGNHLKHEVAADVIEDTLKINAKAKFNKIFSFNVFSTMLELTVYLPQQAYEKLEIKSNNGHISIKEAEANDFLLTTKNGSLDVSMIQGETITLETNNGSIEVKDVISNVVKVDSDNGKITLANIEGEIVGGTNNGKISLVTDTLDMPIDLQSQNGKIDIQSQQKPNNVFFDLKTQNGKITVFGDTNWDAMIGNGENIIKLSTNNGSISISD